MVTIFFPRSFVLEKSSKQMLIKYFFETIIMDKAFCPRLKTPLHCNWRLFQFFPKIFSENFEKIRKIVILKIIKTIFF